MAAGFTESRAGSMLLCGMLTFAIAVTVPAKAENPPPPKSWSGTLSKSCPKAPFGYPDCDGEASTSVSVGRLGPHGEAICCNGQVELSITVPEPQCANATVSLHAEYLGGAILSPRDEFVQGLDFTRPGTRTFDFRDWFTGPWKVTVTVHGNIHYDPAICPGNDGSVAYSVIGSITGAGAGDPVLAATGPNGSSPPSGVRMGDRISYGGRNWSAGSVKVLLENRRVGTKHGPEFSGTVDVRALDALCAGTLTAKQKGTSETVPLSGKRFAHVLLVGDRAEVKRARRLAVGDYICDGDRLHGTFIAEAEGRSFPGLLVRSDRLRIRPSFGVFAPTISIATGSGVSSVSYSAPDPTAFDPVDRAGVATLAPGQRPELALHGFARAPGDLSVTRGGITLDNALLYVAGNLQVRGGIRGTGLIVATRNITVHGGPMDLMPLNLRALVAGGSIVFARR